MLFLSRAQPGSDDPNSKLFVLIKFTHRDPITKRATSRCCAICKFVLAKNWSLGRQKAFKSKQDYCAAVKGQVLPLCSL